MANECNVKVFCRVRPQNALEEATDGRMSIKFGEKTALSHNVGSYTLSYFAFYGYYVSLVNCVCLGASLSV